VDDPARNVKDPRVDVETILTTLRSRNFAVLLTVADAGTSHSAGVTYGVSRPGCTFTLYVMTRRHLPKARDVERNPNVSVVVPVMRRLLHTSVGRAGGWGQIPGSPSATRVILRST
jgi:general stress protein 26